MPKPCIPSEGELSNHRGCDEFKRTEESPKKVSCYDENLNCQEKVYLNSVKTQKECEMKVSRYLVLYNQAPYPPFLSFSVLHSIFMAL